MQKKDSVSMSVIRRLPRYHRFLSELEHKGVTRISSKELSEEMGLTASQIRQDLNCFGGFGQQGYGYNVPQLCEEIKKILGLGAHHKCVLIGAGNLGRAIVGHMAFDQLGFSLIGVFDNSPRVIGSQCWTTGTSPPLSSGRGLSWPSSASPRRAWRRSPTSCTGWASGRSGISATSTSP